VPSTFVNLNFVVVVFLRIYVHKQTKHHESLMERQMIKVVARPTNNAEQFFVQRKGGKFIHCVVVQVTQSVVARSVLPKSE